MAASGQYGGNPGSLAVQAYRIGLTFALKCFTHPNPGVVLDISRRTGEII